MLERGERMPRVDTALRIAGSLGVLLDDLVAGSDWRPAYTIVVPRRMGVLERSGEPAVDPDEAPVSPARIEVPSGSR